MNDNAKPAKAFRQPRPLCYYGDDFTGSTDVLEALFRAGLRAVLFLDTPSPEELEERFAEVDCFGIAGIGRSLPPEAMERELRPIFEVLRSAGAVVVHYKICSTFDSSPGIGSIGRVAEVGRSVFGGRYIPLIAGVPYLRRFTVFGHHFAAGGMDIYRLDRHPTMSRHPATPMEESDLLLHLQKQTDMPTALMDVVSLDGDLDEARSRLEELIRNEQPDLVLFDVLDDRRLETAGRLIWEEAGRTDGLFVIGSSGVEYALAACLPGPAAGMPAGEKPGSVERLLAVSGSCSPVTESQIRWAMDHGFEGIRVPIHEWIEGGETANQARAKLLSEARAVIGAGRSLILYSAIGPGDGSIQEVQTALLTNGQGIQDSSFVLGREMGRMVKMLVVDFELTRVLIAGGDTSGYVTRELGGYALECIDVLVPGCPLCRMFSHEEVLDGLELVLKGGQVGEEDFFGRVLQGNRQP